MLSSSFRLIDSRASGTPGIGGKSWMSKLVLLWVAHGGINGRLESVKKEEEEEEDSVSIVEVNNDKVQEMRLNPRALGFLGVSRRSARHSMWSMLVAKECDVSQLTSSMLSRSACDGPRPLLPTTTTK